MQNDKNFLSRPIKDVTRETEELISAGVKFDVKYVGCIEVFASMKVLDFSTRSLVARSVEKYVTEPWWM
jgi:SHC-transforming protein 1